MSNDPAELSRIMNKTFGNLLSDGLSLFLKNWTKIIIPMALFFVISIILRELIFVDLQWNLALLESAVAPLLDMDPSTITEEELQLMMDYLFSSMGLGLLSQIISDIFTVLSLCSVAYFLYKFYTNQDASLSNDIKGAFNKKMIPILLVLGIGIPLGVLTLFIVSIVIFGFFIFSVYTYQLEDVEQPLKKARVYSKGAFWKLIGALFVASLISMVINFVYQLIFDLIWPLDAVTLLSWYNPLTRRLDLLILYQLASNLALILLEPLFICLLTPIFVSMQAKNQLGYRMSYKSQFSERSREGITSPIKEPEFGDKGIYCPFCGHFMEFKLNFCPVCGEKLNFEI